VLITSTMPLNRLSLPDCPDPEAIRNVYTSRKTYAIAPFPILRWADFRSDLLGSVCVPSGSMTSPSQKFCATVMSR